MDGLKYSHKFGTSHFKNWKFLFAALSWAIFLKPNNLVHSDIEFCNPNIGTIFWRELSTSILYWGKNLERNPAKHEKCNKTMKHMHQRHIGAVPTSGGGSPTIKRLRRRRGDAALYLHLLDHLFYYKLLATLRPYTLTQRCKSFLVQVIYSGMCRILSPLATVHAQTTF